MKQKSKSANSRNILLHLSSIFGIIITSIIWVIFKRKDEIIEFQGRDVINFKFNWILLYIVFGATSLLITKSWSLLIIALVSLYFIGLVISLYNSVRVANNKDYTYPIFIRLLGHKQMRLCCNFEEQGEQANHYITQIIQPFTYWRVFSLLRVRLH